jgi:C-terminal processing protease CtpA/Prc
VKDPLTIMAAEHRASNTATFSRLEAIDELNELSGLLDRAHADPYRFQSRDVVNAERRRLIDTMPASLSQADLCLRLSRLVATLDDGHSSVSCDSLVLQQWQQAAKASPPETQKIRMFQPATRLDDRDHLIVRWPAYAPGIEAGDRLLRINGQDVDALLAAWARETSHDTEAGRLAVVARRFRVQLELHGIRAPYQVTVAASGGPNREVTVQGDPVNYMFQERPAPPPAPNTPAPAPAPSTPTAKPVEVRTPFFNYRMMRPGVAYMDLFTLIGDDLLSVESSFKKSVAEMFRQIAIDKPRVFIIDVRENGGGEDSIAADLYRHLSEKPFRLLSSSRVKRSREVREAAKSIIRIPFRWMGLPLLVSEGREYFLGDEGTLSRPKERPIRKWPRGDPFFDGPVCVLTGPHTYSAGVEFAEAAKAFGLATIVGEETGGQPNSFGNPFTFRLRRSGLVVGIATSTGVRGSGDLTDFKPVMPDIVVRTTAADIQKYFDPVLERAVNCPARP